MAEQLTTRIYGEVDAAEGEAAKEEGMTLAAITRGANLRRARIVAHEIGMRRVSRAVTIDDVQAVLIEEGISLGNAAGSVFKGDQWEFHSYTKSRRPSNHAHVNMVWKLKG